MIQPSLTFLSLSIPAALKAIGSFRSLDGLPEPLIEGVIDTIEALMAVFPEAAVEYNAGVDSLAEDFNHVAEAHRVLVPAVEAASYPLHTEHGVMLADTPLTATLSPHNAMALLRDCVGHAGSINDDDEWDGLYKMTERLLKDYPSIEASIEQRFEDDEPGLDFFREAYNGMVKAGTTEPRAELAMVA